MVNKPSHPHEDKIKGDRFSMGPNLLGEIKTAHVQDIECSACGNKHIIVLHETEN
jgi:hypothetical protein